MLDAAAELVRFDEVERALVILSQVPAHHRDHVIPEVESLKQQIRSSLITAHGYMSAELDQDVSVEFAKKNIDALTRGKLLTKEVSKLDCPHIIEVGPGEYWLPLGLNALGYRFSYHAIAMDQKAAKIAAPLLEYVPNERAHEGSPVVFVAHELIEHLSNPFELATEALKHNNGKWPQFVHLSTPLYTFDCNFKQWQKANGLPHLRAYTPIEFNLAVREIFPGYTWEYAADMIQHFRGYRQGGPLWENK